jgi:hypothetical protein
MEAPTADFRFVFTVSEHPGQVGEGVRIKGNARAQAEGL